MGGGQVAAPIAARPAAGPALPLGFATAKALSAVGRRAEGCAAAGSVWWVLKCCALHEEKLLKE